MKQRIEKKLKTGLSPELLEIKNNSYLHRGHAGDDGSDETHFAIKISSKELKILTRMEGHRKVNQLLKDEFKNGLHALEVEIV